MYKYDELRTTVPELTLRLEFEDRNALQRYAFVGR